MENMGKVEIGKLIILQPVETAKLMSVPGVPQWRIGKWSGDHPDSPPFKNVWPALPSLCGGLRRRGVHIALAPR